MSISTKTTQKKPKAKNTIFKKQENGKNSVNKKNTTVDNILNLHQSVGNQAVQWMFEFGEIQASLKIGQPNDIYEQEADRVADQVMRMSDESVQREPISKQITPLVQTKSNTKTPQVTPNFESKINTLRGSGQCLSPQTRNFFEPRFGHDFSGVRIHTDSNANQLARSINARAFTRGSDVVFGGGEYRPESESGKRLLGHELVHVVQQRNTIFRSIQRKISSDYPLIKSYLTYDYSLFGGNWAIEDNEITQILEILEQLSQNNLRDTVKKIIDDGLIENFNKNISQKHKNKFIGLIFDINQIQKSLMLPKCCIQSLKSIHGVLDRMGLANDFILLSEDIIGLQPIGVPTVLGMLWKLTRTAAKIPKTFLNNKTIDPIAFNEILTAIRLEYVSNHPNNEELSAHWKDIENFWIKIRERTMRRKK